MRADLIIKSKSLTGSSDLTLLAPLKRGLVPSLDALTYKTRTQRLLMLLNGGRTSSHEYSLSRPISDSVERVARIHSFRVAVLEPEDKVLLAVTFDGTWESYIRVLWQKVGSLLDVIFCNTEGYVLSLEGFDAWTGWVNRVQIETAFFFNTHGLTVGDAHYLRAHELIHRREPILEEASLASVRLSQPAAEEIAFKAGQTTTIDAVDTLRQGLQALALLFRLTDAYLPGTADGDVLLRAARDLLVDFLPLVDDPDIIPDINAPVHARFDRQLSWLNAAGRPEITRPRQVPGVPEKDTDAPLEDVQGGILASYDEATHGCLLLLAFDSAADAAAFLSVLEPLVTTAATPDAKKCPHAASTKRAADTFVNVAFTVEGLRRLGMSESELSEWLPQEFLEGMEERSSMLGDFRANHPRRWVLPRTNWSHDGQVVGRDVQMSAVHAIVQIRAVGNAAPGVDDSNHPEYPLRKAILDLVTVEGQAGRVARTGVRLLSVQTMQRLYNDDGQTVEHFGFADGQAQPDLAATANARNRVQLGEVLLGYANEADPAPATTRNSAGRLDFLRNGTFMVVRKLRQDVRALREVVRKAGDADATKILDPEVMLAKMMGRWRNGGSLVTYPTEAPALGALPDNDFDFDDDDEGTRCPFHSHIRRANPRTPLNLPGEPPGRRRPRLVRRGMSYGPRASVLPGQSNGGIEPPDDATDRGLVFIAYNASISEQFEIIQRWLSGGNSTGGFSGHSDPFLGVPEPGQQRYFRFEAEIAGRAAGMDPDTKARVFSIPLDKGPDPFKDPESFVRLQWGAYLFIPSMHTLKWLRRRAQGRPEDLKWPIVEGQHALERLERVLAEQGDTAARDAWKAAIEDAPAQEQLRTASLWAAIRRRGGALRTPYGVLVATNDLVKEVLGDDQRFSVCGYRERMVAGRFDIYLGLDKSTRYKELSDGVNGAIMAMKRADTFQLAAATTEAVLRSFMSVERASGVAIGAPRWELNLDAKEVIDQVQQRLCQEWLGLPARRGGAIEPGSWRWDWTEGKPSVYPSHLTPPSRYFFQPCPGEAVRRYGERYAAALATALEALVEPYRKNGTVPLAPDGSAAPLAVAILKSTQSEDDATVARIFAGVLMGFLPTLDGNLRLVLNEWLRLKTFWGLRADWSTDSRPISLAKAVDLLEPAMMKAMQFRPSPELIWRTAQREVDAIGDVALHRGDRIVLALVSATQELMSAGRADVMPIFGGARVGPHPTHACPGYEAAMGVMLGVLAAFIDVPETMRPSPAPLAFTFEGPLSQKAPT